MATLPKNVIDKAFQVSAIMTLGGDPLKYVLQRINEMGLRCFGVTQENTGNVCFSRWEEQFCDNEQSPWQNSVVSFLGS